MNNFYPYIVEQTRNRHSRATVRDGTIVIRLGKWLTKRQKKQHISQLYERMLSALARQKPKEQIDPFADIRANSDPLHIQLSRGKSYTFRIKQGEKEPKSPHYAWRVDDCILRTHSSVSIKQIHRSLWRALGERELDEMKKTVEHINQETMCTDYSNVRLRLTRRQWGSCSHRGNISLNTALLFLPRHLLEYVIIHELAHRIHADHSKKFWDLVEEHCPSYREDRKELRQYELPSM